MEFGGTMGVEDTMCVPKGQLKAARDKIHSHIGNTPLWLRVSDRLNSVLAERYGCQLGTAWR